MCRSTSGKERVPCSWGTVTVTGPAAEQQVRARAGGLIQLGNHLLKTWSRTQDSVTLSSAEAELVALSKLAAEVLGVRSMAIEWRVIERGCTCPLYTDASAALSIA